MENITINTLVFPDSVLATNKTPKIKKIFHISDIHINLYRRHEEYRYVFNNLYKHLSESIQFNNIKSGEAIIIVTGDILHSKTELSPECIYLTMDFFIKLSKIAPLIIIAGNHDANLNNKNRLDALSPIIEHLDKKILPIYYFKESGVYNLYNISFGVTSVFDYNFIKASDIPNNNQIKQIDQIKIGLYHGMVKSDLITNDVVMLNEAVLTTSAFAGYDYVLLGDIHKFQYLNKDKTIAYAGSLIQQNYGESIDNHGVLEWDLTRKTSELKQIESSTGFITLTKMDDLNKCCLKPNEHLTTCPYPKNIRVRLVYEKLNAAVNDKMLTILKQNHTIVESRLSEIVNDANGTNIFGKGDTMINVSDVDCQYKYIETYLGNNVTPEDMEKLKEINKELNQTVENDKKTQNLSWKLRTMRWSNMFSFGEDNFIDFSKLNNIVGIIGPNHTGKSAIIDIILYTLYHKFSRKGDIKDIININHESFNVQLTVQIGNKLYHINKKGQYIKSKKKLGELPVGVEFFETALDGTSDKIEYNGHTSKETLAKIAEYFGSYDDVVLTNVSLQNNNTNFVDMTDTPRKTELERLLKIDIFSALKDEASRIMNERKAMQKYFDKLKVGEIIAEKTKYLGTCEINKDQHDQEIKELDIQIKAASDIEKASKKKMNELERDLSVSLIEVAQNIFDEFEFYIEPDKLEDPELVISILKELREQTNCNISNMENISLGYEYVLEDYYEDLVVKKRDYQRKIDEITKIMKTKMNEPEFTIDDLMIKLEKSNATISKFNACIVKMEKDRSKLEKKVDTLNTELNIITKNRSELMKNMSSVNVNLESQINELYVTYTNDIKKLMMQKLGDEIKGIIKGENVIPNLIHLICTKYKSIGELSPNYQKYIKLTNDMESFKAVSVIDVKIGEINHTLKELNGEIEAINDAVGKNGEKVREYEKRIIDINACIEYVKAYDVYLENKKQLSRLNRKLEMVCSKLIDIESSKNLIEYLNELIETRDRIEILIKNIDMDKDKQVLYKAAFKTYEDDHNVLLGLQMKHKEATANYYRYESEYVSTAKHLWELQKQSDSETSNTTDIRLYQYYLDAVRNIPFMIIDNIKVKIESLINEMLAPLTDFTIHFEIVENKHISIYLKRHSGVHRREILLSNASGFEKFISSLFIRVALIQISNLPKSNFIVIDEGWGCFDASNINNAGMIFDFLKEKFDFVLTISHIQDMRQHLNHQIVITQDNGYSHVSHNLMAINTS